MTRNTDQRRHTPESAVRRRGRRLTVFLFLALCASVSASPALAAPPETQNIQQLADGLGWYALAACLVGITISAAMWAMGSKGQNPGQELTGKKGLVLCCTAAFFVGATPHMVNFYSSAADAVKRDADSNFSVQGSNENPKAPRDVAGQSGSIGNGDGTTSGDGSAGGFAPSNAQSAGEQAEKEAQRRGQQQQAQQKAEQQAKAKADQELEVLQNKLQNGITGGAPPVGPCAVCR